MGGERHKDESKDEANKNNIHRRRSTLKVQN